MRTQFEEIIPKDGSETEIFVYNAPQDAASLGTVAILIDTTALPDALRYFGALISGTFRRSYYTGGKQMQRSFTAALRSVNDALAEEARSGTGQWIGMLHAVIAASDGSSIVLATTGGFEAHIARDGQLIELPLEAGEGTRPFGSYTSGALHAGDVLLTARRGTLDGHGLRERFAKEPAKIIKRTKHAGIGALAMTTSATNTDSGVSRVNTTVSIYASVWRQVLQGGSLLRRGGIFLFQNLMSHASQLPGAIRSITMRLKRPRATHEAQQPLDEASVEPEVSPKPSAQTFSVLTTLRQRLSGIRRPNIALPRSKPLYLAGLATFLLLLASGVALVSSRSQQDDQSERMAAALAVASAALERGETQIILGDTQSAVAAFSEGLEAIDGLISGGKLRTELTQRRNTLSGIRTVTVETALSFAGFPVGINAALLATTPSDDGAAQVALAGKSHPAVWLNSEIAPSGGTFFVLPLSFTSGISALTAWDTDQYIATTREGIAILSGTQRNLLAAYAEESATAFHMLAAKDGSGFVLTGANTIEAIAYDPDAEEDQLTTAPWLLRGDARLSEARDMILLTDGPSVLLEDNTFLQFRRGRNAIRYTIEGFDWDGVAAAFTPLGENRILILDTRHARILLAKTNGDILEQYEIPGSETGRDIVAIDTTTVLLLTDSALLHITLPEPIGEPTF